MQQQHVEHRMVTNVVWGALCGGADCRSPVDALRSFWAPPMPATRSCGARDVDGDTVVWGTGTVTRSCGARRVTAIPSSGAPRLQVRTQAARRRLGTLGRDDCPGARRAFSRIAACVAAPGAGPRGAGPSARLGCVCPGSAALRRAVIIAGALTLVALLPAGFPQPALFCRPRRLGLSDVVVEGQPADRASERLDALGVVRSEPDGTAAARAQPCAARGARGRLDSVHVQGQEAISAVSHGVQCRPPKRSRWRRPGVVYRQLGGPISPLETTGSREAAGRRDLRPTSS